MINIYDIIKKRKIRGIFMRDKKIIVYVKERNSEKEPTSIETKEMIDCARKEFPNENLIVNIELEEEFKNTRNI